MNSLWLRANQHMGWRISLAASGVEPASDLTVQRGDDEFPDAPSAREQCQRRPQVFRPSSKKVMKPISERGRGQQGRSYASSARRAAAPFYTMATLVADNAPQLCASSSLIAAACEHSLL